MPTETPQTRALRNEVADLAYNMKRNAEKRDFASARATKFRAEATLSAEHLRTGNPEVLRRDAREYIRRFREGMYEVVKQESIALEHAFTIRLLERQHKALAEQLEAALRAANQPAASRR